LQIGFEPGVSAWFPLAKEGFEMRLLETRRREMKLLVLLASICAFSGGAMAQAPDCKSISNSGARLACYDKATPPVASPAKSALRQAPVSKLDSGKYVDTISAEDAQMNARLKTICRGC
jgi:hypothetical protein